MIQNEDIYKVSSETSLLESEDRSKTWSYCPWEKYLYKQLYKIIFSNTKKQIKRKKLLFFRHSLICIDHFTFF